MPSRSQVMIHESLSPLRKPHRRHGGATGACRTSFNALTERLVPIIRTHCTFPQLDLARLYRLILFSFLVGNEDLHLKNISLIRTGGLVRHNSRQDEYRIPRNVPDSSPP